MRLGTWLGVRGGSLGRQVIATWRATAALAPVAVAMHRRSAGSTLRGAFSAATPTTTAAATPTAA
jgi:hypothetical protein